MQCVIANDAALDSVIPSRWVCKTHLSMQLFLFLRNSYGLVGLYCLVRPYNRVGVKSMTYRIGPEFENRFCCILVGALGQMIDFSEYQFLPLKDDANRTSLIGLLRWKSIMYVKHLAKHLAKWKWSVIRVYYCYWCAYCYQHNSPDIVMAKLQHFSRIYLSLSRWNLRKA